MANVRIQLSKKIRSIERHPKNW